MWLKKYKKDIILLGSLVLVTGLSFLLFFSMKERMNRTEEKYVRIESNEQIIAVLTLNENLEKEFLTFLPDHEAQFRNTVTISGGFVSVSSADCPEQICVHTGKKCEVGDSIVCLPHKFVVTIISKEEAEALKEGK